MPLVTDGLPALALVGDPIPDDLLRRRPRKPDEPMLGRPQWTTVIVTGLLQAAVTISVYAWALNSRGLSEARNLAFSAIVFSELFRSFAARSTTRLFWEVGAFTNLRLLGVVLVSGLVQLGLPRAHERARWKAIVARLEYRDASDPKAPKITLISEQRRERGR